MFQRFKVDRCKTQCSLCKGRIKIMRNKRNIKLNQLRSEVADLLRNNKQEHARIRVEAVLREYGLLKSYDILELFIEMLENRVMSIEKSKDTPLDMLEALSSIVYASQRLQDFPELEEIRKILAQKYGKEFVAEAADDSICRKWQVNENLRSCLAVEAPAPEIKLQMLSDIAQEYNVEWDAHAAAMDMLPYSSPTTAPGYFNGPQAGGGNRQQLPWDSQQQQAQQPDFNAPSPTNGDPYASAASVPPPTSLPGARGGNNNNKGGGPGNAPVALSPPSQGHQFDPQHPDGHPPATNAHAPLGMGGVQLPPNAAGMTLEEYADAMAAANAARMYSTRAQQAAESAARHAASPGRSPPANRMHDSASPPPTSAPQAPPQAPPPSIPPPQSGPKTPPPTDSPAPTNLPPGQYKQLSDEEIQRRYDAAPGPPTKPQYSSGGTPSAPPRPGSPGLPPRAPSPSRPSLNRNSPSSTSGNQAPSAPAATAPRPKPANDIDELTKRFEALKRG